jgi:hypothetical protein
MMHNALHKGDKVIAVLAHETTELSSDVLSQHPALHAKRAAAKAIAALPEALPSQDLYRLFQRLQACARQLFPRHVNSLQMLSQQ